MNPKVSPVSPENKRIAQYVTIAFGGSRRVAAYVNTSGSLTVDILYCQDRPQEGLTSYSTIGLSDHPMIWGNGEFPTRLELAGVCESTAELFPNILASTAFEIIQSDAVYHPGTVIPNIVRKHYSSSNLPHIYLTAPFIWENQLKMLDCGTKKVSWLLALPISEPEYSYLRKYGDHALEQLFESRKIDFASIERSSVV